MSGLNDGSHRRVRYQGAVLVGSRILLICNHDRQLDSTYWLLPGGGRKPGESPRDCVRRELREETGLDVQVGRLLLDIPSMDGDMYERLLTFECSVLDGVAAPGVEPEVDTSDHRTIVEVRWLDLLAPAALEIVREDPFTFPQLLAIRDLLEGKQ